MNVSIPLRYALAAAMLSLLFSGVAQAACEWSDRIDKDEAECLSGEWTNRTWPDKDTASVKNECSALGKVVAKVDREGATDWTPSLNNDVELNMSGTLGNIRNIYCCSDLSDLCNKADVINPDGCWAQFHESPASDTDCYNVSFAADLSAGTCTISGICHRYVDDGSVRLMATSITVPYERADEIQLCDALFCL